MCFGFISESVILRHFETLKFVKHILYTSIHDKKKDNVKYLNISIILC